MIKEEENYLVCTLNPLGKYTPRKATRNFLLKETKNLRYGGGIMFGTSNALPNIAYLCGCFLTISS